MLCSEVLNDDFLVLSLASCPRFPSNPVCCLFEYLTTGFLSWKEVSPFTLIFPFPSLRGAFLASTKSSKDLVLFSGLVVVVSSSQ